MFKKTITNQRLLLATLCFGFLLSSIILSGASTYRNYAHYPTNENGQTYGSGITDDLNNTTAPDLIFAEGVDGNVGYVLKTDLEGCEPLTKPNNPEEAIVYMENLDRLVEIAKKRGEQYLYYIPLYESDGKTVIGRFGISIPERSEIEIVN